MSVQYCVEGKIVSTSCGSSPQNCWSTNKFSSYAMESITQFGSRLWGQLTSLVVGWSAVRSKWVEGFRVLPTRSRRTPPRTERLFLALSGSPPRLMQGMDMRTSPTAGRPRMEPVIIRALDVWMYAEHTHKHTDILTQTQTHIYADTHTHIYTETHVYTHTCTHRQTNTYTHIHLKC